MSYQEIFKFENPDIERIILGSMNHHITLISEECHIPLLVSSSCVMAPSDCDYQIVVKILGILSNLVNKGVVFKERDILGIIKMAKRYESEKIIDFFLNKTVIVNTSSGKAVYPKNLSQKHYFNVLKEKDIIFAVGSAGTGKTYLAVAFAVSQLKKNIINKIIITRPAVEAGEKLGFLPGDLKEKVDPYLVPIYDAIYEFLGKESADKLIERGIIEIAPLAYMRGRTLDNAFIILDEAQNTTRNQMKMFLTRLGFNSKMVITGDVTQIDLPHKNMSGLIEATKILKDEKGIEIIAFDKDDVMRHPLVSRIIEKYEEFEND
ncbi:MAG: PhoH family protein [Bacilli bacterium]|nr:PhoH family protein [Bacilli bacterium]